MHKSIVSGKWSKRGSNFLGKLNKPALSRKKRALEEKRAAENEALQNRYQLCLSNAEDNYSRNWADQCKKVAAKAQTDRAECLAHQARHATSGPSLVTDRLVPAVHRMWRSRFCEHRLRTIAAALKEQI